MPSGASDSSPVTLAELREVLDSKLQALNAKTDALNAKTDALNTKTDALQGELSSLKREMEPALLDLAMLRERARRLAGVGDYREPVRSETETRGDGNASYIWERRPATPRLG